MAFAEKLLKATHVAAGTDKLLNAEQAGSLLGLQPGTMYDLVQQGKIDYVRLFGKTLRFRESVILKIIQESEVKSTNSNELRRTVLRDRKKKNNLTDGRSHKRGTEAFD